MRIALRSPFALAAMALALLTPTPGALAQDAGDTVDACLAEMGETVGQTTSTIEAATDETVMTIIELDENGASNQELRRAAAEGRRVVKQTARAGKVHISAVKQRCVHELRQEGAPPEAIFTVKGAAVSAKQAIHISKRTGIHTINVALADALTNDPNDDTASGNNDDGLASG